MNVFIQIVLKGKWVIIMKRNINYRFSKKIVCMLIVMLMLLGSFLGGAVSAAEVKYNISTVEVDPLKQESGVLGFSDALCDSLAEQLRSHSKYIYITGYSVPIADASSLFTAVLFKNPDLFYVDPTKIGYANDGSGNIALLAPGYLYTQEELPSKVQEVEDKADLLLSDIGVDWDQATQVLRVHDELILDCEYAKTELEKGAAANPEIYTAYGALVNGEAVCQGYTLGYNYILSKLGIDTSVVISYAMNHSWTMAKIDGDYYHIDVTWDDPTYDKLGQAYHTYFMKSDSYLKSETSANKHYDWVADKNATDTSYDNMFWHRVTTQIIYENENYYYISNISSQSYKGYLVKYDGIKNTPLVEIGDRWYANKENNSYWMSNFSYLDRCGDKLYYNTTQKVYSVNLDGTDKKEVYSLSDSEKKLGDIYGIKIGDDNYIYLSLSSSPNDEAEEIKTNVLCESGEINTKPDTKVMGDIDGNGNVNIIDATKLQLIVAKHNEITEEQKLIADLNNDNDINILDVTYIQMICANLI